MRWLSCWISQWISRCLPNCEIKDSILRAPNFTFTNLAEDNLQYCLYTHLSICPTFYYSKTEWICEKNHFGSVKNIYSNFKSQIFYDDYYNGYSIYISYDRANRVAIYWAASLLVLMLSIIMSFRKLSESYTKILKGDESWQLTFWTFQKFRLKEDLYRLKFNIWIWKKLCIDWRFWLR